MIGTSLVRIFITSVFLVQHVKAHDHHHHHVRSNHAHEQGQNERHLEYYGINSTFATFEEWVSSDEFKTSGARCGTKPAPQEPTQDEIAFQEWVKENSVTLDREVINIDLVWHNVLQNDGTGGATISQIAESVTILNNAYVPAGFRFVLVKTTTTPNSVYWNSSTDAVELEMKKQLRQGTCSTLNVYSTGLSSLLGYAYFPDECKASQTLDGVVINYRTVPGGSETGYNLGDTLVHEVGHWMGLYHTFEGCAAPGDYVDDTPPEANADYECNKAKNECGDGILDDVTNFMNYGNDACIDHFTSGQIARMKAQFQFYRNAPAPTPTPAPTSDCFIFSQISQAVTGFVSRAKATLTP